MGDVIQNMFIAGLFASFIAAMFLLPIAEFNNNYDADIDDSNLSTLNKLTELESKTTSVKNEALENTEVGTQDSEVSFLSNAFSVSKTVFTGGAFSIISQMFRNIMRFSGVSTIIVTFLLSTLIIILSFAAVKKVFGR